MSKPPETPVLPLPPHRGGVWERSTPGALPREHVGSATGAGSAPEIDWKAWKARLEEQMEQLHLRREERRAMRAEFAAIRKAGLERRHKAKLERNP